MGSEMCIRDRSRDTAARQDCVSWCVGVILFSLSFGCQKIGSPCGSFGPCLRSSAVIVRCSPLQRRPKRLSQQNWGGRVRARWWWWWFSVLSLFFVFTSLRARLRPALGLAGVLELAMRLSYLRVVLSFYGSLRAAETHF